jgi:hypothetical protein
MIAAVVVIIVVAVLIVAPAHALVVTVVLMLTVSHGLLFNNSFFAAALTRGVFPSSIRRALRRAQIHVCTVALILAIGAGTETLRACP